MKRLPVGVHRVSVKLASGKRQTYFYAWRGGPRVKEKPGTRAFDLEVFQLSRHHIASPTVQTFGDLVTLYQKSAEYHSLKPRTRKNKVWALQYAEEEYFDMPVAAICDKGMRADFKTFRDRFAHTPRKADEILSAISSILTFAADSEMIDKNPLLGIKKLSNGTRRDRVWNASQISSIHAVASPEILLAFEMARWTGQRQGDLLRLTWAAYDGKTIRLTQGKTGAVVYFEVYWELRNLLNRTERKAVTILTNTRGQPWRSGFGSSFIKTKARAKLAGANLTFHDLRGTFVGEAYRKGATIEEIAEITGHSKKEAESIIRHHYLPSTAVVRRLETRTNRPQSVKRGK